MTVRPGFGVARVPSGRVRGRSGCGVACRIGRGAGRAPGTARMTGAARVSPGGGAIGSVTGTIPGTAPPCDSRDIGRGEVSGGVASASPGIRASTSAQKARLIPPPR
ncbi:MAG: hypothetical protein R3D61_09415 [Defluviimonas denitrificans]